VTIHYKAGCYYGHRSAADDLRFELRERIGSRLEFGGITLVPDLPDIESAGGSVELPVPRPIQEQALYSKPCLIHGQSLNWCLNPVQF